MHTATLTIMEPEIREILAYLDKWRKTWLVRKGAFSEKSSSNHYVLEPLLSFEPLRRVLCMRIIIIFSTILC
jgi:hypothetical protein